MKMFSFIIGLLLLLSIATAQFSPCDSLICDFPKQCKVEKEVAQCVLAENPLSSISNLFGSALGQGNHIDKTEGPTFPTTELVTTSAPQWLTTEATTTGLFGGLFGQTGAAGSNDPFGSILKLLNLTPPPPIVETTQKPFITPVAQAQTSPTTTAPPEPDVCILPPLTGNCGRARIMWYYDNETRTCERFSFSGCGNSNRFESRKACEKKCLTRKNFHRL